MMWAKSCLSLSSYIYLRSEVKYGLKLQEGEVNQPPPHITLCDGGAGHTPVEQSYWVESFDFDSVTFNITSLSLNGLQLNQQWIGSCCESNWL